MEWGKNVFKKQEKSTKIKITIKIYIKFVRSYICTVATTTEDKFIYRERGAIYCTHEGILSLYFKIKMILKINFERDDTLKRIITSHIHLLLVYSPKNMFTSSFYSLTHTHTMNDLLFTFFFSCVLLLYNLSRKLLLIFI